MLPAEIKGKEPRAVMGRALRDDEETAACRSYQRYLLNLSLFQLKDEPEGEGNRAVEEGSFWFEIG